MLGDIVTRLREMANDLYYSELSVITTDAADEIERLRAENDGLRVRIYTLLKKLDEQAVRGDA